MRRFNWGCGASLTQALIVVYKKPPPGNQPSGGLGYKAD